MTNTSVNGAFPDNFGATLLQLPFVKTFGIRLVSVEPGQVSVELPYEARFSTPPNLFPASVVGAVGDVAAIASCSSALPVGRASATLDFTIKMTGIAKGGSLVADGRVLQNGRTTSVGAADIYSVSDGVRSLCGTLIATSRNFDLP